MQFPRFWMHRGWLSNVLLPLSWIYLVVILLRKFCFWLGVLRTARLSCPVIVVGNIMVGGTGKTPFVLWLIERLRREGWSPGVVSRGYGARAPHYPCTVLADSLPALVGDEPVLIAQHAGCPVVVDPWRARGAQSLIQQHGCDVIICDDGLQHYYLSRDLEIALVDASRMWGNGRLLPAGPLREPAWRLKQCNWVIFNGEHPNAENKMILHISMGINVIDGNRRVALRELAPKIHAVAGIGHPARFFDQLRAQGLHVIEHGFPDHHAFQPQDIDFKDGLPVVMTAKDWVKIRHFAHERCWYVPLEVTLSDAITHGLSEWSRKVRAART
jgi:tetraacyldisaccharide 4'-kinase